MIAQTIGGYMANAQDCDLWVTGRVRYCFSVMAAFAVACAPALAFAGEVATVTSSAQPTEVKATTVRQPAAAAKLPGLGEAGQQRYREYLSLPKPRAFAISRDGHYGFASGTNPMDVSMPADPKLRALDLCKRFARAECTLYSIDDQVVFSAPAAATPPVVAAASPVATARVATTSAAAQVPEPPEKPAEPLAALVSPPSVTWVFEIAGEHGLNDLYTLSYTQNGSTQTSKWTIQANTGLGISGGVSVLPLAQGRLRTRATAGFKFTAQSFSNAEVVYYAFPLEVIETFEQGPIRLGAGMYALLGPTLSGSGTASGLSTSFDSTLGLTARAEWVFNRRVGIGLRYIWNRLSVGTQSVGAPAIGAVVSLNGDVGM